MSKKNRIKRDYNDSEIIFRKYYAYIWLKDGSFKNILIESY